MAWITMLVAWLVGPLAAAPAGAPQQVEGPALDLSSPRHVRALYLDLLGRTPDSDELLLAPAAGPERLVAMLCGSAGFWEHWYEDELYYFLLLDNFRPVQADGELDVPQRLARGELSMPDAVRGLVSGSAFHRANPGNDTFVSVVLEQLLGLTVQDEPAILEAGKRMYDGRGASLWGMPGRSQADVVRIACAQAAFPERLVERQYERLVGRPPGRRDAQRWSARLAEDPRSFVDLVQEWVLSPAYARRLSSLRRKTDRQFLRGLLVDLTGDVPDAETEARARAALAAVADAGPLRSVIARVVLGRHGADLPERGRIDGHDLVEEVYLRFLGRDPGPDERDAMVLAYEQCGDCDPDTVVLAIVTHWEYQYY